jgi:uncharacterized membrane protein YphA (DoxX/SURF4 family)
MPDWMLALYDPAHLVGRCLFALVFIKNGIAHLTKLDAFAGFAAHRGVPAPRLMTVVTGLMIIVGGTFVALGWSRFIGAGLIALFCFPTAFLMHPYWKEADPGARMAEQAHFYKDLALGGAALFIAYNAGVDWPFAVGTP